MDQKFLQLFLEKTDFPAEGEKFLRESAKLLEKTGLAESLDSAVKFFYENDFNTELTQPLVEKIGRSADLSPYTVWMLLLIEASLPVLENFRKSGTEGLFWATFADLRYKALECKEIYNVWGTFVAFWYPIFYSGNIVKLGRLEFENGVFPWDTYSKNGITLRKGDPVKNIHIPSSGEPFDQAARLDSYRQAYEYFQKDLHGGPLVCVCHSWLLYPEYGKLLSPSSNILSFQRDFDLVGQDDNAEFGDAWRLFGAAYQKPATELPEDTSMRRAFKKHLLADGKTGEGRGILVFDGTKIINR